MKIPKGWRKLEIGEKIKSGDKFNLADGSFLYSSEIGHLIPAKWHDDSTTTYIRRIERKKK